jgi:hypothetical protein
MEGILLSKYMKKGSRSLKGNNQKVESFFMTIAEFTKLAKSVKESMSAALLRWNIHPTAQIWHRVTIISFLN